MSSIRGSALVETFQSHLDGGRGFWSILLASNCTTVWPTLQEIMDAVVPPDHPEFRERPAYRYGIERLLRRHLINAVHDREGKRHYFIGNYASAALRKSLGI